MFVCVFVFLFLPPLRTPSIGLYDIHPVSVTRFLSFRTQPLENLSHYLRTNGFLSNPAPGESLVSGNLVMETGCRGFPGQFESSNVSRDNVSREMWACNIACYTM